MMRGDSLVLEAYEISRSGTSMSIGRDFIGGYNDLILVTCFYESCFLLIGGYSGFEDCLILEIYNYCYVSIFYLSYFSRFSV